MRVSQILTEKLINVKLNQSIFDIPLNCILDINLRNLIVLQYYHTESNFATSIEIYLKMSTKLIKNIL